MKGGSNIISGVHCLRQALDHFESFQREHPGSKGDHLFAGYAKRLNWIATDLITHPLLPESVRSGVKAEWNSDAFAVPAIAEKAALLNPEQRESVEALIDQLLLGETLTIVKEDS